MKLVLECLGDFSAACEEQERLGNIDEVLSDKMLKKGRE